MHDEHFRMDIYFKCFMGLCLPVFRGPWGFVSSWQQWSHMRMCTTEEVWRWRESFHSVYLEVSLIWWWSMRTEKCQVSFAEASVYNHVFRSVRFCCFVVLMRSWEAATECYMKDFPSLKASQMVWFSVTFLTGQLHISKSVVFAFARKWRLGNYCFVFVFCVWVVFCFMSLNYHLMKFVMQ